MGRQNDFKRLGCQQRRLGCQQRSQLKASNFAVAMMTFEHYI